MKIRTFISGLTLSFLTACQAVFFTGYNFALDSDKFTSVEGVSFSDHPDLKLDIYQPVNASTTSPVLVFMYGGGWTSGKRSWYKFVGAAFASAGFVTVIPDYRKGDETPFPGFMFDAAKAVSWTKDHIAEYGGNASDMFLAGHSAGGHIAVLLATDPTYLQSEGFDHDSLRGVIGYAGAYDFLPLSSDRYRQVFGDMKSQQRSQPVNYASKDDPPFLLIQGLDDDTVIPRNARNMASAVSIAGGQVETRYYEGAGHLAVLLALSEKSRDKNSAFNDSLQFMHQQLASND